MTDLEMTKLCAEAMGYDMHESITRSEGITLKHYFPDGSQHYDPLHDDAQAMALVKKFDIDITRIRDYWDVDLWTGDGAKSICCVNAYLNRAIVECVAKMQERK